MTTDFWVALILLAAGFTQGLTGFGAALVAMPLLVFVMDIREAVPLCMLNGLIINAYLCLSLRRELDLEKITPLFWGSLPGILVGVFFLKGMDTEGSRQVLGGLVSSYGLYALLCRPAVRPVHPAWSYVAGFSSGAISTALSAGGPPAIMYTAHTGWPKDDMKATLSGFFLASGIMTTFAHAWNGMVTPVVIHAFLASISFVIIGVIAGSWVYQYIDKDRYQRILLLALILSGMLLILP